MKSRNYFFILLFLIAVAVAVAVAVGGFNFFKVKKTDNLSQSQQKQIEAIPDTKKEVVTQKALMEALDSVKPIIGATAPNFSLKDQHGNMFGLEKLKTPKALLVFSSATCPSCKEFYPHLQRFKEVQDKIDIAIIQLDANAAANLNMLESNGYNFTLLEGTLDVFDKYRVISTPTSILIDTKTKTIIKSGDLIKLEDIQAFVAS